jgi:hypothetical protein
MYTIRGFVRQGDSSGPIIDLDGKALPIGVVGRRVQRSPRVCAARRPLWLGGEYTSRVNDAPTRWVTLRGTASVTTNVRRLRLDQRRD